VVPRNGTKKLQAASRSRLGHCGGAANSSSVWTCNTQLMKARVGSPGRYVSQKSMLSLENPGKEGRFQARSVKAAAILPG